MKTVFKYCIFLAFGLAIAFVLYLIWTVEFVLTIVNERNNPVSSNLTISENGKSVFEGYGSNFSVTLWKGDYQIAISSKGYEDVSFNTSNLTGTKLDHNIVQTITMKPVFINLSGFSFFDPTGTLRLSPQFHVVGTDILQDKIETTLNHSSSIMYGFYNITAFTSDFYKNTSLEGDMLLVDNKSATSVVLVPNERFFILSEDEKNNVLNFLKDYLSYSANRFLDSEDAGFPKQFFLYNKSSAISLGDMIFLFCEQKTFENSLSSPIFFVPKNFTYTQANQDSNFTSCYSLGLDSLVPNRINGKNTPEVLIESLLDRTDITYPIVNLNSKDKKAPMAFSFDIESGRYVNNDNKGPNAISPCKDSVSGLGLDSNELVCNDANYVAWFSPLTGHVSLTEYPYPWVSGLEGLKEIMSYSEDYGLPQTFFMPTRDYKAFQQLDPSDINKLKDLVGKNLIEIGVHTRYHTRLGSFNETVSEMEISKSKEFLSDEFKSSTKTFTITGFRAPYHSITDNSNYKEFVTALKNSGLDYWSDLNATINFTTQIKSKPVDYFMAHQNIQTLKNMIENSNYVISIAHPWNIFYDEVTQDNEVYLKENTTNPIHARSAVLVAISNGAVPMKISEIPIK